MTGRGSKSTRTILNTYKDWNKGKERNGNTGHKTEE
jgi:hypothetical protein